MIFRSFAARPISIIRQHPRPAPATKTPPFRTESSKRHRHSSPSGNFNRVKIEYTPSTTANDRPRYLGSNLTTTRLLLLQWEETLPWVQLVYEELRHCDLMPMTMLRHVALISYVYNPVSYVSSAEQDAPPPCAGGYQPRANRSVDTRYSGPACP
jgi:hypothetical protein